MDPDRPADGNGSTGGLTDRQGTLMGKWHLQFIDWARDIGFLDKPGVETKAAKDVAAFVEKPPRPYRPWDGPRRQRNAPPAVGNQWGN